MELGKYSMGIGDRFGRQGKAQLEAIIEAKTRGIDITPVWNKSFREHDIIGTHPEDVRHEADSAVKTSGWEGSYFVDADHVGMGIIDPFIEASDFFTLDVADFIDQPVSNENLNDFIQKYQKYVGPLQIDGIHTGIHITESELESIAQKFLFAIEEAGRIYRHIVSKKPDYPFVIEVSMDETETPQTPVELFFILAAIADQEIPVRTIAPKFTGRFNKGVDYVGDLERFSREFEEDLAVIRFAVQKFNLPEDLKLSVHSGSDKFAIYGPMKNALKKYNTGLHLKTAGTTWLEELIGLAEAGGDGLDIAREIYYKALDKIDALCKPYATVIDIDPERLPQKQEVGAWDGKRFARGLRHDASCSDYNPDFRQLLHVGYKVAANLGERYLDGLKRHEDIVGNHVTENLFRRHIMPLFG